jgi:hypothetical protein
MLIDTFRKSQVSRNVSIPSRAHDSTNSFNNRWSNVKHSDEHHLAWQVWGRCLDLGVMTCKLSSSVSWIILKPTISVLSTVLGAGYMSRSRLMTFRHLSCEFLDTQPLSSF